MRYTRFVTTPNAGILSRARSSGAWYLAALLVAPTLYDSTDRVAQDGGALGVLPWSLVALYSAAAFAVVCWVRYSSAAPWSPWMRGWLYLGVILWLFVLVSSFIQGQQAVGAAALVPLTYLLILIKRPSREDCWRAADAFAWVLVAFSAFMLALEVAHVIPAWYAAHGQVGTDLLAFDQGNYWLPLRSLLGLEGRWGGMAGFPNIAGQVGALLIVYGLVRPNGRRAAFVTSGIVTLLLTDSRTSFAAAAVGLLLIAALPGWGTRYWHMTPTRIFATCLGLAFALRVLVKIVLDPALTGRLAMWPQFLSLVRGFMPFGAGQRGIDAAISSGQLPAWAHQGHNIFLDALVRHGVVGLLLTVGFMAIAIGLTVGQARRERGVGLALVVALIVSCLGDLGVDWTYPSEGLSFLLVAVMVAQSETSDYRLAAASSKVATSTTSTPSATPSD